MKPQAAGGGADKKKTSISTLSLRLSLFTRQDFIHRRVKMLDGKTWGQISSEAAQVLHAAIVKTSDSLQRFIAFEQLNGVCTYSTKYKVIYDVWM